MALDVGGGPAARRVENAPVFERVKESLSQFKRLESGRHAVPAERGNLSEIFFWRRKWISRLR